MGAKGGMASLGANIRAYSLGGSLECSMVTGWGWCRSALSAVSEMEFSACGRVVPSTSLMAGKGEDRTWPSRTRNDGQDIQPRPRRIECRSFLVDAVRQNGPDGRNSQICRAGSLAHASRTSGDTTIRGRGRMAAPRCPRPRVEPRIEPCLHPALPRQP